MHFGRAACASSLGNSSRKRWEVAGSATAASGFLHAERESHTEEGERGHHSVTERCGDASSESMVASASSRGKRYTDRDASSESMGRGEKGREISAFKDPLYIFQKPPTVAPLCTPAPPVAL